eukprot:8549137-Pyramimonas_sp.AAC.1
MSRHSWFSIFTSPPPCPADADPRAMSSSAPSFVFPSSLYDAHCSPALSTAALCRPSSKT